jgi:hypothetical protein
MVEIEVAVQTIATDTNVSLQVLRQVLQKTWLRQMYKQYIATWRRQMSQTTATGLRSVTNGSYRHKRLSPYLWTGDRNNS